MRPEISQAESLLAIGTRRIFSEEHDIFRESVRKFVVDHVKPHHDRFVVFSFLIGLGTFHSNLPLRWEKEGQVDREVGRTSGLLHRIMFSFNSYGCRLGSKHCWELQSRRRMVAMVPIY